MSDNRIRYTLKGYYLIGFVALLSICIINLFLVGSALGGINDGLIAYWSFDNPSDPANDDSGNGHDGTVYGATWTSNGASGGAMNFDGSNDYIEVSYSSDFAPGTGDYSVSIWAKAPIDGAYQAMFILIDGTCYRWIQLSGMDDGGGYDLIRCGAKSYDAGSQTMTESRLIRDGIWHHIVFVRKNSKYLYLYIDGILKDTNQNNSLNSIIPSRPITIGWGGECSAIRKMKGDLDELRVYNRALSEDEIEELYNIYPQAKGDLIVSISPAEARNAGAQWRVDGGAWRNSGYRQTGLSAGQHMVEFNNLSDWSRPGNQIVTVEGGKTTETSGTYIQTYTLNGVLDGVVSGHDENGNIIGRLSDAQVEVSGYGITGTDTQGAYRISEIPPGNYTITVSKTGYYPSSKEISLAIGETKTENFQLTAVPASAKPILFDFSSPDGKHFIPGMPGDLHFSTKVSWNGSPGFVRFLVAGQWHTASITDLGGGQALAELTISAPGEINTFSELTIEAVNGAGIVHSINTGINFSPIFEFIPWYDGAFPWVFSGSALSYSDSTSRHFDLPISLDNLELEAFLGYDLGFRYDLMSSLFSGSLGGNGGLNFVAPVKDIEVLGGAEIGIKGELTISILKHPPTVTPSFTLSGNFKTGVRAPVVIVLDFIAPGLGSSLASIPGINNFKLQLYLLLGGEIKSEYYNFQTSDCWLGVTSYTGSITGGLEATALFKNKLLKIEAGAYVGGTGTFHVGLCPEFSLDGFTGEIYAGVYSVSFGYERGQEVSAEITWDFTGGGTPTAIVSAMTDLSRTDGGTTWQPIGKSPLKWGEVNRLPEDKDLRAMLYDQAEGEESVEVKLLENVIWTAHPSLFTDSTYSTVLYSLHDTEKPWYSASDIAEVYQDGTDPWETNRRITDDLASEFTPEIVSAGTDTLLGAWTRVDGDISETESPEDVVPYLEIVASFYNRNTGTWIPLVQLTDNDQVDHDPLPVVFGTNQGVLWIQNQGGVVPGTADSGDSLMYAGWTGGGWSTPTALWSGSKGILDFTFVSDDQGEGHVVLAVDEDGDPDTTEDRELYLISTQSGVWGSDQRLTDNSVEDALPVLVSPDGDPMLVWSSDTTLMYTYLDTWDPQAVYAQETLADEAPTLDGVTMSGGAAIGYSVQSADGMDLVAAFYDSQLDQWSLPRQLTHDEDGERSLSMGYDGSELVMAYLKTQTLREDIEVELDGQMQTIENVPQPGRTDLYVLRHNLGYDLAVSPDSVVIEPANPAPGTTVDIHAEIQNLGDLPVQNLQVSAYDGDPELGGTQIGQTVITDLIAGGSQEVTISWDVSADLDAHRIFVVADPALGFDDRDRSNNSSAAWTVLPDLEVQTCRSENISETEAALTATIQNDGVIPSGLFNVCWRLGSEDGEVLGCNEVQTIGAGSTRETTLVWDQSAHEFQDKSATVYVIVDSENGVYESDESNNSHFQVVPVSDTLAPSGVVSGDFDGDNKADILFRDTVTGQYYLNCMDGNAVAFEGSVSFNPNPDWQVQGIADFNGDGQADVLLRHSTLGSYYLYTMNGNNIAFQDTVPLSTNLDWQVQGMADFNGDGKADVLVRNESSGLYWLYLMDGNTVLYQNDIKMSDDLNWQVQGIADFDADGDADVLLRNEVTGVYYLYCLNGLAVTSQGVVGAYSDPNWQMQGIGDFNGDGKSDILVRNASTGAYHLYCMNGNTIEFQGLIEANPNPIWQVQLIADFNGDGKSDILVRNTITGAFYLYCMNGNAIISQSAVALNPNSTWEVQSGVLAKESTYLKDVTDFNGVRKDRSSDPERRNRELLAVFIKWPGDSQSGSRLKSISTRHGGCSGFRISMQMEKRIFY